MTTRKYIGILAASAALLGLTACGSTDADTMTGLGAPLQPQVQSAPPQQAPEPPPLPLPEVDDYHGILDQAFLDTLAEEGIDISDEAALDAANVACGAMDDGLFPAIRAVQQSTGLTQGDAAYLVGAAAITCGGQQP